MKMILSTVVGSRLHGTHNEDSDYDYRGVFILPLSDLISPFKDAKTTHWIEGEEDNTAYELTKFCKMCSQGNPSVLEVLVGEEYPKLTPEGKVLRELLPSFLSKKCINAFYGYSKNQEKKFRDPSISNQKGKDVLNTNRKYKYATAHVRTMYQLRHLLKENELIGTYPPLVTQTLKEIKNGNLSDAQIMDSIFNLENECRELEKKCTLPDTADIEKIEKFIISIYA